MDQQTPTAARRYAPDEGSDLHLRGIDDAELFNADGSPMTISLLGTDSDAAERHRHAASNRRLQQGARMKLTSEGLDSDGVNYLAELSVGWNITPNLLVPGVDAGLGEGPVGFSRDAAKAVYRNSKLKVIKEQVEKFIDERSNFLKA